MKATLFQYHTKGFTTCAVLTFPLHAGINFWYITEQALIAPPAISSVSAISLLLVSLFLASTNLQIKQSLQTDQTPQTILTP